MATVTGFTSARMLAIENSAVTGGSIVGDNLVLQRHDTSTFVAGNVRGPIGPPGDAPVGSIVDYINTTAPANWLAMTGQTIVNGQTLWPLLWAVIPASMKSGSSIVMPDTRGRVAVGYDTTQTEFDAILETGGEKAHTLTQAELPAATITINPPNTAVTIVDPGHVHPSPLPTASLVGIGSGFSVLGNGPVAVNASSVPSIPSGTTGISASVDIAQFASGNLGSGTSHNVLQPYVTFLKILKAA